MFIEDIVELVNKFTHVDITDFKVEFREEIDKYMEERVKDVRIVIK